MNQIVAIPSQFPGGLEATVSAHFGHCDLFTMVNIEDGRVEKVAVMPGVPHEQGGCLAPVNLLAARGVKALIAGGMGMRPLMGFNQAGIEVFHHAGLERVKEAVEAFLRGALPRFGQNLTCGGGEEDHHGPGGSCHSS